MDIPAIMLQMDDLMILTEDVVYGSIDGETAWWMINNGTLRLLENGRNTCGTGQFCSEYKRFCGHAMTAG